MIVSLYFDTKNFWSANFSRIVITILVVCCHRCSSIPTATLTHNIPTSELQGDYPSRAVYDLMLSLSPLFLTLRMLRLLIIYKLNITTAAKYISPNSNIAVKISSIHIFIIISPFDFPILWL